MVSRASTAVTSGAIRTRGGQPMRDAPRPLIDAVAHDDLAHRVGVTLDLVADGGPDVIAAVGMKIVLHQQRDLAGIYMTRIEAQRLGHGRPGGRRTGSCHPASPFTSLWMVKGCRQDSKPLLMARTWGTRRLTRAHGWGAIDRASFSGGYPHAMVFIAQGHNSWRCQSRRCRAERQPRLQIKEFDLVPAFGHSSRMFRPHGFQT